jgi:hypothetical protein
MITSIFIHHRNDRLAEVAAAHGIFIASSPSRTREHDTTFLKRTHGCSGWKKMLLLLRTFLYPARSSPGSLSLFHVLTDEVLGQHKQRGNNSRGGYFSIAIRNIQNGLSIPPIYHRRGLGGSTKIPARSRILHILHHAPGTRDEDFTPLQFVSMQRTVLDS